MGAVRLGGCHPFGVGRCRLIGLALTLLLQLCVAVAAGPSVDDIDESMKFVVMRTSLPGCEPNCPQWIWARGAIDSGTAAEFKRFLKKLGDRRLPIVLSSPGGDIDAAMKMGRMIRERNLDVAVGSAYLTGCPATEKGCAAGRTKDGVYYGVIVEYGEFCNSACPLVLAGGVQRLVGPTVYVGIHQITTTITRETIRYREKYQMVKGKKRVVEKKVVSRKKVGSYQTTKLSKGTERKVLAYLNEMGVAKSYFTAAQAVPAKDLRRLERGEMTGMNLTTGDKAANSFTRAGVCQAGRPAAHCIGGPPQPPSKPYPKAIVPQGTQMWFAVVRSSESGCEPDCPEWISAEGDIGPEALSRLAAMLEALGGRKLPLVVSSRGGDAEAAMAMGRLIRKNRLDVAIGSTVFAGCKPRDKGCTVKSKSPLPYFGNAVSYEGQCLSDCTLLLAAGKARLAGYGVRMGWYQRARPSAPILASYLDEMGIRSQPFDDAAPIKLAYTDQMRLMRAGLLTRQGAVDMLIDGGVCGLIPIPANCKLAKPGEFDMFASRTP